MTMFRDYRGNDIARSLRVRTALLQHFLLNDRQATEADVNGESQMAAISTRLRGAKE